MSLRNRRSNLFKLFQKKFHEFKDGTIQHKSYFIEFYDIGGSAAHKSSAKMFYSNVDGKFYR